MTRKILICGEGLTTLRLYVGVLTCFMPETENLACLNIAVLAEDEHTASVMIAQRYTEWDLQALTCISDFPWFKFITLDDNCPQVATLREFRISDIKAVPLDEIEGTYKK